MPLKEVERVFECEANILASPPFPTNFPTGGSINLCTIALNSRRTAYLIRAVVNWSATFIPLASALTLSAGGLAQVQFEIVRDGVPIARVTQTVSQAGAAVGAIFATASTAFDTTPIQTLDSTSLGGIINPLTIIELRASNIILTPPLNILGTVLLPIGSVTAAAGLVSLVVEEVRFCRSGDADSL